MISFGGAKHDAWLSAILATVLGLGGVYLMITLGLRYSSQTIIQYSQGILGIWLGRFIGLLYISLYLIIASFATRDYTELYMLIMPDTPVVAFTIIILLMAAYAAAMGLEVIARTAEVLVPIIFLAIFIGILGNSPNMKILQLSPLLENGWPAVIMDAVTELPYFGLAFAWLFLLPSLNIKTEAKKSLLLSTVITGIVVFFVSITIVMVIGAEAPANRNYQFFNTFRQIRLSGFMERVEPLFLISWSSTSFLFITLFFYVTVNSVKQWLGLKSDKPLILPVGIIIFILSMKLFSSYTELRQFFSLQYFGMIALPMEFGIPLILLGISYIKEKNKTERN